MAYDINRRPRIWISKQASHRSAYVWLLAALLTALALLALALLVSHRIGLIGCLLLLGLIVLWKLYAEKRADEAVHWLRGARAEEAVGEELDRLEGEGFVVKHDIEQKFDGNVDHFVSGPTGVYMIETKARGYLNSHLPTARRRAKKLHHELGVWVTPVICIPRRGAVPFKHDGVWIVPLHLIADWLRKQ
jgi:hypothetical protein